MWNVFPNLTDVLCALTSMPTDVNGKSMTVIKRFIVLLYDRTSSLIDVIQSRKELFSKKLRNIQSIRPSKAALLQHTCKTSSFSRSIRIGSIPFEAAPCSISFCLWLGESRKFLETKWATLPQAKDSCYELIHCGCKKDCKGRCK